MIFRTVSLPTLSGNLEREGRRAGRRSTPVSCHSALVCKDPLQPIERARVMSPMSVPAVATREGGPGYVAISYLPSKTLICALNQIGYLLLIKRDIE